MVVHSYVLFIPEQLRTVRSGNRTFSVRAPTPRSDKSPYFGLIRTTLLAAIDHDGLTFNDGE